MANHTDKEYMDASTIAYFDFLGSTNEELGPSNGPYSIKELVEKYFNKDLEVAKEYRQYKNPNTIFDYKDEVKELKSLIEYSDISDLTKKRLLNLSDDAYNWTLLEEVDKNADTGFYGCLLGTSENDAMVAFRGSEGYKDADGKWNYLNTVHDWLNADFKLLGGETLQDQDAKDFAKNVVAPFLKEHPEYEGINVTGHSLGGELATMFTLYCAEEDEELYDKIGRCVNLDGPGKDQTFIEEHQEGILKIQEKTTLYRASLVGEMLYPLASEENIKYVQIENEYEVGDFDRHSMLNWEVNEKEEIVEGNRDEFAKVVGDLSRRVDNTILETGIIAGINWLEEDFIEETDGHELVLSDKGKEMITHAVEDLAVIELAMMSIGAGGALLIPVVGIAVFAGVLGIMFIGTYLYCKRKKIAYDLKKFGDEVNLTISTTLKKIFSDSKSTIERVESKLGSIWDDIKTKGRELIDPGYMTSSNQTYIKIDTKKLIELSDRIDQVRRKIKAVDQKIDTLYSQVKLYELPELMARDIGIGDDAWLKNCSNYLRKTAENFEKTENKIIESFQ